MASGSQNNTSFQAQKWTNLRAFTIGNTAKDVDGTAAVSWSKNEILGASDSTKFYRGDKTWSNTLTNMLILDNGSVNGELLRLVGVNDKTFSFKLTSPSGQTDATNVDIGWDWAAGDGAGAAFRSALFPNQPGYFVIYARTNTTDEYTLVGKTDGTLTWTGKIIPNTGNTTGTVGGATDPIWVNAGVITAITAGTTGQFYRGDKTWSNALTGDISIGSRGVTSGPSSITYSNRITIVPYFHTGGPWYIKSGDDSSNAYLALYYNTTQLMRIKHDGTQMVDWKGNANTSTKWASAQTVYVTLGTASKTTTIQGGSSSAHTLGVDGTLGVGNGGTGKASWTKGGIIYASATNTLAQIADGSADKVLRATASATYSWLAYTSAATASTIVYRDASKNFSAGTITATFSGNLTGNVTGDCSGSSGSCTGNAATATNLVGISMTGGNGNTGGRRLIYTWTINAWSNHRLTFAVTSRHTGSGLVAVSVGCNSNTVSLANCYAEIKYFGPTSSGGIISATSYEIYINSAGTKAYLFWQYTDYNDTSITPISGGLPSNGTWTENPASYGTLKAQTEINVSSTCYGNAATATALYTGDPSNTSSSGQDARIKDAIKAYFDANKASIPRNKTISLYVNTGSGEQATGYFLNGYDSAPYGGFFVCHYDTPRYVGISNGSYSCHELIKNDSRTYSINVSGSSGSCTGSATGLTGGLVTNTVTSHGNLAVTTAKGSYYGINLGHNKSGMSIMSINASHQGLYNETNGQWILYYNAASNSKSIAIGSATINVTSGISLNLNTKVTGTLTVTGQMTGNLTGDVTGNCSGSSGSCTGNAATASKITNITTSDAASSSGTQRYVWIAYSDNATGRPSYSTNFTYQTSTDTLFAGRCIDIRGATNATMTSASTNPRICFSEKGTQPVYLLYSDYDSYRSPAGLKVVGGTNATPAWFEVEGSIYAAKVYNAVWNDFAEYRASDITEGGRVLVSDGKGHLILSTERLQPSARVVSDTFGCSVGMSDNAKTPIGVAGRVLVYPYQPRENYKVGDALCAAPNGTADIMTREEIIQYPDRIIGIVDEVPDYEIWDQIHTNKKDDGEVGEQNHTNIEVKGRIWIYVK